MSEVVTHVGSGLRWSAGWYGPLSKVQTTEAVLSTQRAEFVNVIIARLSPWSMLGRAVFGGIIHA
ncbi:hypothetical protein BCB70_12045 [Cutibacterium modestum]|nr:hypothetical protein BCB70_12045 [Cutibacterium modestum]